MKRYWKIILICLVTLMSIGTFYIHSSFAKNDPVKIEFTKISGDENEVKDLLLFGDYMTGDRYRSLLITNEETKDPDNLSFLKKIERLSVPTNIERLVKEHKNFMRSKDLIATHFFEDEDVIAYAGIQADNFNTQPIKNVTFDIEVLHKKTDKIASIQLNVPEREKYSWMHVEDVQVLNGELKVITRNFGIDNREEYHAYSVDMNERKIIRDDIIASGLVIENGWTDLRMINDVYSLERNKYLLIQNQAFKEEMVQNDGQPNEVLTEHVVYDIENNQSKKVVVPDEALDSIGVASAVFNSTIFITSQSAHGVEVHQYDIENEKWDEKLLFSIAGMEDDKPPYLKVMNGKLYAVYATTDGYTLFIGDLKTGESLYEGKLELNEQGEDDRLTIYEIENV